MNENQKWFKLASLVAFLAGVSLIWFGLNTTSPVKVPKTAQFPTIAEPVISLPASASATAGIAGEAATVVHVVDGDTIEVQIGTNTYKVRYIGIDTPETVDPRRPIGCFGKEASNENKRLVEGKSVILQKDVSDTDKYKRLLRYVYLPLDSGRFLFIDDYLVREGYARVLTYPPDIKFNDQLLQAQQEAKANKRGLWASCP